MEYYEILKEIRIDKDLSQTQVAKKLGTTQQQIYKYENGLQTMTVDRLKQFCILYEISADNILNLPNKKGKGIQTQNRTKYTFLYKKMDRINLKRKTGLTACFLSLQPSSTPLYRKSL